MPSKPAPKVVFTDRYDVFGPPGFCKGDCEGTGMVPVWLNGTPFRENGKDDASVYYRDEWRKAEAANPTRGTGTERTHFIKCYQCKGTRKANP